MVGEAEQEYAEDYWRNMVLDLTPDTLVQWHLGNTETSCETCAAMASLGPLFASEFVDRDTYPQSESLDCQGFNCRCFLTIIDRPDTGIVDLLADIGAVSGSIGDEGLAALFSTVHAQIIAQNQNWAGMTPVSAGLSWFDAPATSAGSFTGLRYGGDTVQGAFEIAATPPNRYGNEMNQAFNARSMFTVAPPQRMPSGDDELTMGQIRWQQPPVREPSTFDAPASSAGSFKGSRYGD